MHTWHARPRGGVRWPFTQLLCLLALSAVAHDARAHPAPFSYLDLHLDAEGAGGRLVIHDFDAAYELGLENPEALLEPSVARARADELLGIVAERLRIVADGEPATPQWRPVEVLAERWDLGKRIRDVEQAPDGSLWLLEDANPGALMHLTPK